MKNRKGIIKVGKDWVENFKDVHFKDENLPKELFSRVVPIRIEEKFETGELLYFCLSEYFEEIKEGEDVPYYEITVSVEHGIFKNIIFKRLPSPYQEMDDLRRENQNLKYQLEKETEAHKIEIRNLQNLVKVLTNKPNEIDTFHSDDCQEEFISQNPEFVKDEIERFANKQETIRKKNSIFESWFK